VKSRYIFLIDWVSLITHDLSYLWSGQPYIPQLEDHLSILFLFVPRDILLHVYTPSQKGYGEPINGEPTSCLSPSLEIRWTYKLLHKTSCHLLGLSSIFFLKRLIDLSLTMCMSVIWRWIEQFNFIWLNKFTYLFRR